MIYNFDNYEREIISLIQNNTNGDIKAGIHELCENIKDVLISNIEEIQEQLQLEIENN